MKSYANIWYSTILFKQMELEIMILSTFQHDLSVGLLWNKYLYLIAHGWFVFTSTFLY